MLGEVRGLSAIAYRTDAAASDVVLVQDPLPADWLTKSGAAAPNPITSQLSEIMGLRIVSEGCNVSAVHNVLLKAVLYEDDFLCPIDPPNDRF